MGVQMHESLGGYGREFELWGDTVVLPTRNMDKVARKVEPPALTKADYAYDSDDPLQVMALSVAWKSKSTVPLRIGDESLRQHMADCVGVAMVAAYEPPTLQDYQRAIHRKVQGEDGEWRPVMRDGVSEWDEEELLRRARYKHIEKAVGRYVKDLLRGVRVSQKLPEGEELEEMENRITANRINDRYLQGEGSEYDRLDKLVEAACERLLPKQQAQLRALVKGTARLSDLSPAVRRCLREATLDVLHL